MRSTYYAVHADIMQATTWPATCTVAGKRVRPHPAGNGLQTSLSHAGLKTVNRLMYCGMFCQTCRTASGFRTTQWHDQKHC